ncbi:MAG: efflux RND transporter periplasmic adaptor subunit [Acidobacteria bacterium]|jgi:HlyD family secretion protein|nr:efflux RND transporter periplasmic adaptor subunit [Acidobacteriota bacterium]
MKKSRWILAAIAAVALFVVFRYVVFAPEIVQVRTAEAELGLVEETVTNTRAGTVKVRRRAELSPQIGGLVVALPHREGDRVEADEVVVVLDSRAQRAELVSARTAVDAARAQADEACLAAELAQKELVRVEKLHAQGIASDQNLDILRTDRDRTLAACSAARASVGQAESRVIAAEVQLQFTELRAPFAGKVAEVSTEIGEYIMPSPPGLPIPPVIDLLDPASIYISGPIDEVDAERLSTGLAVRVTVDSRPDQTFEGRVARVAPYVLDVLEQNRTVEVEVELSDPAAIEGVLPGTSADVELILDRRENTLRIPASAVAEGSKVLVLEDGLLVEKEIGVGLRNWRYAEVLEGLKVGEKVVVVRNSPDIRAGARAEEKEQ